MAGWVKGLHGWLAGLSAQLFVICSCLIRTVITTPADDLILGDEQVVWADAAYHTHARLAALKARGIKPRLAPPTSIIPSCRHAWRATTS